MNNKLGAIYTKEKTIFRVFAQDIQTLSILIYDHADAVQRHEYPMHQEDEFYTVEVPGDLHGKYYLYRIDGKYVVTDPASVSLSMNSKKSVILDLEKTNPPGWHEHKHPVCKVEDAILYEVHVKDYTVHESAGVLHPGKYLGMAESGKVGAFTTGLNHLVELGISHVHLLPIQDFITVHEDPDRFYEDDNFNWGYDPEHFNAPEGSYSTDSRDPIARILELKTLIQTLHEHGIQVILDVVYNHTYRAVDSNFNMLAPNYYYRQWTKGIFANGSGCGNEMATEKEHVRAFILNSISFWLEEYKVDGFRFDLMALVDIETVQEIVNEAKKIHPHVLIYGEPWAADKTPLSPRDMTTKGAQKELDFSLFNDDYRNALKGGNDDSSWGYIQGDFSLKPAVEQGILGGLSKRGDVGWTAHGQEAIQYFNSHDNLILYDKLKISMNGEEDIIQATKLAFSILLTSFGIPFFHAGNEFMRSKGGNHNTYNSPLSVNAIQWTEKEKNIELVEYIASLIAFRKSSGLFSEQNREWIQENVSMLNDPREYVIAYEIRKGEKIYRIVHNASNHAVILDFQEPMEVVFGVETGIHQGEVEIPERTTVIYER